MISSWQCETWPWDSAWTEVFLLLSLARRLLAPHSACRILNFDWVNLVFAALSLTFRLRSWSRFVTCILSSHFLWFMLLWVFLIGFDFRCSCKVFKFSLTSVCYGQIKILVSLAGFLRNACLVRSPRRFCSFLRHCVMFHAQLIVKK